MKGFEGPSHHVRLQVIESEHHVRDIPCADSARRKGGSESLELRNPKEPARVMRTVGVRDKEGGDGCAPAGDPGGDPAVGELEDLGLGGH